MLMPILVAVEVLRTTGRPRTPRESLELTCQDEEIVRRLAEYGRLDPPFGGEISCECRVPFVSCSFENTTYVSWF